MSRDGRASSRVASLQSGEKQMSAQVTKQREKVCVELNHTEGVRVWEMSNMVEYRAFWLCKQSKVRNVINNGIVVSHREIQAVDEDCENDAVPKAFKLDERRR